MLPLAPLRAFVPLRSVVRLQESVADRVARAVAEVRSSETAPATVFQDFERECFGDAEAGCDAWWYGEDPTEEKVYEPADEAHLAALRAEGEAVLARRAAVQGAASRTTEPMMRTPPPQAVAPGTAALLVILVGMPGSGKSTFVKQLLSSTEDDSSWSRVSQDVLGKRHRCIRAAEEALCAGQHVIIDRCNFDEEQRAHWLRLRPPPSRSLAIFLDVPMQVAYERVLARPAHEGGVDSQSMGPAKLKGIVMNMRRKLTPPRVEEGFSQVIHCITDEQRQTAMMSAIELGALVNEERF